MHKPSVFVVVFFYVARSARTDPSPPALACCNLKFTRLAIRWLPSARSGPRLSVQGDSGEKREAIHASQCINQSCVANNPSVLPNISLLCPYLAYHTAWKQAFSMILFTAERRTPHAK